MRPTAHIAAILAYISIGWWRSNNADVIATTHGPGRSTIAGYSDFLLGWVVVLVVRYHLDGALIDVFHGVELVRGLEQLGALDFIQRRKLLLKRLLHVCLWPAKLRALLGPNVHRGSFERTIVRLLCLSADGHISHARLREIILEKTTGWQRWFMSGLPLSVVVQCVANLLAQGLTLRNRRE